MKRKLNKPNKIHTYSEGQDEEYQINSILEKGHIGDEVHYMPNNQLGMKFFVIVIDENTKEKTLKQIGDYEGYYSDPHHSEHFWYYSNSDEENEEYIISKTYNLRKKRK